MHWVVIWLFALSAAVFALWQARQFYLAMMKAPEGTPRMVEIAGYVRTGADAYLRQQYSVIAVVFLLIFLGLLALAFGMHALSGFVPFAFLVSGFLSAFAGWLGMKTATQASSRAAAGAEKSINDGLQVAFRAGAVMGLVVVGLALLDLTLWFAVLHWIVGLNLQTVSVTMLCFGMGASGQALFARVGGGIFTKAADVGADLVGKVEKGIPEDDARNPATIADNVGDNVGDVAGMGADLYESYYGALLAASSLGVAAFADPGVLVHLGVKDVSPAAVVSYQTAAFLLPFAIAASGIFFAVLGVYCVKTGADEGQRGLLAALARGLNVANVGTIALVVLFSVVMLGGGFWTIAASVGVGLFAGWLIGVWTEYCTSSEYAPTRKLAEQAVTGPATVIIGGIAAGMLSTWVPVLVVGAATLSAFGFASHWSFTDAGMFPLGLYGVGVGAVGMLSTLGITLATDAYGPIADNAGGNAQMAELDPAVRERTDALDSLGNTTAATGKGFAIGSAALTTLALLAAYVEEVRVGFHHWGDSAVAASAPVGVYRVSDSYLLQVESGAGHVGRHGWLVYPGQDPIPAAGAADAGLPLRVDGGDKPWKLETVGTEGRTARLVQGETRIELVRADRANLRDFMRYYDANLLNPKVLVGILVGTMITFVFCALTMQAVGRAASQMVEEVRRQFREKPGILENPPTAQPDYAVPVQISTKAAQREMILPALLGLATPVVVGLLLGVGGVLGLLVGSLASGFAVAIFMANSGGAWDNAKKYIEGGALGGKTSEAHKAAVVGDTVGDPFKDTSGPSLNILIKLMSMVSVVAAGLVVRYSLHALGIF